MVWGCETPRLSEWSIHVHVYQEGRIDVEPDRAAMQERTLQSELKARRHQALPQGTRGLSEGTQETK